MFGFENEPVEAPEGAGTTRATVNSLQAPTTMLTTDAFGNAVVQWGSSGNPYRFAGAWGYRDDGDAGLLHVGARYYDPQVGRFISRDAVLSEHPYLYCEHEPVNAVDPDGRRRIIIDKIEIDLGSIKLGGKIDPPFKIVLPPVPPWIGRLGQVGAVVGAAVVGWEIGDHIAENYIPREWYERAGEWLYNLWPGIWHSGL